jgi:HAD superfamily phosphoserine phosphatase-like hydrolase
LVLNHPASSLTASAFLQQVLDSRPAIAAFDCDGTLWSGDAGADFFYWEMERGYVPPEVIPAILQRYQEYKAGRVDELAICGEMIQINRGVKDVRLRAAAREFFSSVVAPRIFPEMRELISRLAAQGCELWAVSSTNNWVVEAAAEHFEIPAECVLAATLEVEDGCVTDRLLRVPTDELKQEAIEEIIARPVDAVFGNSMHDFAMLERARDAYAIHPNPDLERRAAELGWTVYWPENSRRG